MLSLMLVEAGLRPSFLIGADVDEIGTNAVWDGGEWLVLEADESYGTFAALEPELAVVTNVEPDHLDHYRTFAALSEAFGAFLAAATGGRLVGADDPVAAELGRAHGAAGVGEAEGAAWRMTDVVLSSSSSAFDLSGPDGPLGRLELPGAGPPQRPQRGAGRGVGDPGRCAIHAAAAAALGRFAGVPRRFEFRGEAGGVTFVDDYAHLPSEVARRLGGGPGRGLAPGGGRLPAPPLHQDGGPGRRLRAGLRRRRRGGGDRCLRCRGAPDPRRLGTPGGRRRGHGQPLPPPRLRPGPRRAAAAAVRAAGSGGPLPHARGGRPHHPPRRALRGER